MLRLIVPLIFFAPALAGCGSSAPTTPASAATATAKLSIQGMTCASCAVSIRTATRKLEGVSSIEVDAEQGSAQVSYDPSRVDAATIAAAITDLGYKASVVSEGGA